MNKVYIWLLGQKERYWIPRLTVWKLGNQVTLWILGNEIEKLYENEYIGMYSLGNQVTKRAFR